MLTPSTPERISRLTSKGQVTIPLEVRRVLGVEPHDRVVFVVEAGEVRVRRAQSVVQRTAGALKEYFARTPLTAEQEREFFQDEVARDAINRSLK